MIEMPSFGLEQQFARAQSTSWDDTSGENAAPESADEFAQTVIRAICHASVTPSTGQRSFERCMRALEVGSTARAGFRHPGKANAIDLIWRERHRLFAEYAESPDKLRYLATLPWVGPTIKHSLARRLGVYALSQQRAA